MRFKTTDTTIITYYILYFREVLNLWLWFRTPRVVRDLTTNC